GDGPPRAVRKGAADDYWRVRFLNGLWPRHHGRETDVAALVFGLRLTPDRTHGFDALAHDLETRLEFGAVVAHLLRIPPRPDAKQEAAARYLVQACHLLSGLDGIALDHEADTGGE